jgi:UDP-galactopyranose mutase
MRRSLLVFSHLRWDFVYQRPQQLMSRLGRYYKILFIEEPVLAPSWELEVRSVSSDITVVRLHAPAFDDVRFRTIYAPFMRSTLRDLLRRHGIRDYGAWFYTPMALPLLESLAPRVVVYDCMDELSAFMNAPPLIAQRERELFRRAQLVFTGGPSLQRAKSECHPSVYCFPSSVDSAHFARAALPRYAHHEGAPQLGYYGVIDERIDLELVRTVADLRPDWQINMVGPVAKIPPDRLPQRPNIRYAGQQPYESLPGYVRQWDVCLMPFAINDATRYISPTKTLEYMAAAKSIVSTPITDVVEPYGDLVRIAANAGEFVRHCELALAETRAQRRRREAAMAAVVARGSWDRTAADMHQLMEAVWPVPHERQIGSIERASRPAGRAEAL